MPPSPEEISFKIVYYENLLTQNLMYYDKVTIKFCSNNNLTQSKIFARFFHVILCYNIYTLSSLAKKARQYKKNMEDTYS